MNPLNHPSLDSYITDSSVIEALIKDQQQLRVLGSEGVKFLLLQFKSQKHAELILNTNLDMTVDKLRLKYRLSLVKSFQEFISETKNIKMLLTKYLGFDEIFETFSPQNKQNKDQIFQYLWNDIQKGNLKLNANIRESNTIYNFIANNLMRISNDNKLLNQQPPKQKPIDTKDSVNIKNINEQQIQEITYKLQNVLLYGANPRIKPQNASTTTAMTTTTTGISSPMQNPSHALPINGQNFANRPHSFSNDTFNNQIPPHQNRTPGNTQQSVNIISTSNTQHIHPSLSINANTQRNNVDNGVTTNINRTSQISTSIPINVNNFTQSQTATPPRNSQIPRSIANPQQRFPNHPQQVLNQQQGSNFNNGNQISQPNLGPSNHPGNINNFGPPSSYIPQISNPQFTSSQGFRNNNLSNNINSNNNNAIVLPENVQLQAKKKNIHELIQDFVSENIDLTIDFARQPKLLSDIYDKLEIYVQDVKLDETHFKVQLQQIEYDPYVSEQTYLVLNFRFTNENSPKTPLSLEFILTIQDKQFYFQLKRFKHLKSMQPEFLQETPNLALILKEAKIVIEQNKNQNEF